jgi:hypothetical protein
MEIFRFWMKGVFMVKAGNKKELLENSKKYYDEIKVKEFQNNELNERDKTISDVLCHLNEWHNMMENWSERGNTFNADGRI